jgi:hypothetical protein
MVVWAIKNGNPKCGRFNDVVNAIAKSATNNSNVGIAICSRQFANGI